MQKSITNNFTETQKLGEKLAKEILEKKIGDMAVVLCLEGDLGAGKTTFLQGFAKGLGIQEVINSPTFVIMKKFAIDQANFNYFYHIDCYRLENEKELEIFNFKEIISDPKNIVAIEWPEKISKILPKNVIKILFSHKSETERSLQIIKD